MGTRNLTCVVLDKKYRVAQYGQWDGYPTGQGQTAVEFIVNNLKGKPNNLAKFKARVRAIQELTKDEANSKWGSGPNLSRDTGAEILEYVYKTTKPKVFLSLDFAADGLFCEWAYVLDLDKSVLEVYKGFGQSPLTPKDRFYFLQDKASNGYYPVKLVAKYGLSKLTKNTMTKLAASLSEESESVDA